MEPTTTTSQRGSVTAAAALHGRTLVAARAAWLTVAAATVGAYAASAWVGLRRLQGPCPSSVCQSGQVPPAVQRAFSDLHLSVGFRGDQTFGLNIALALGFAAVAALIFWRKSRDLLALYISLALLIFGTASFEDELLLLRLANPAWQVPIGLLGFLGVAGFGAFLYVFPDGRFVPRWTFLAAAAWALWMLPIYFVTDSPVSWVTWPTTLPHPVACSSSFDDAHHGDAATLARWPRHASKPTEHCAETLDARCYTVRRRGAVLQASSQRM